ncbi:MAG TPA: efflux RND transporter periplasmic adaptor subunit, partial [Acidimicrobiales bacterium]|nr:efflux RND transporter periplasmic adaptor subunit [Acidimicrobiales bacterium]
SSAGSGSVSSSGAGVAYNSAQQLAGDQAQIDAAEAQLVTAKQALADATLTSPLSGTVAAVNLTAGQTVSANATSDAITIVNSSGYEATASLDDTEMAGVKVGEHVDVSVNGRTGTVAGTVSRLDPVQQSDGDYVYPVVIALSGVKGQIPSGTTADLSIVLHSVSYTLAVPTSAVHTAAAGDSYVEVLRDGKQTEQRVTVGVVGGTYTQIKSGLARGETVVLANLSAPIPTSNSGTVRGLAGRGLASRA